MTHREFAIDTQLYAACAYQKAREYVCQEHAINAVIWQHIAARSWGASQYHLGMYTREI